MPKMVNFGEFFENLKLAVKQYYQTGHFQKYKNWWKTPKLKKKFKCDNLSNLKQCVEVSFS